MGNQQRSAPESIEVIQAIHQGLIGRPYFARAWYANTRGSIGYGQPAPVPEWLDYELWQGPAPRRPYQDNVVHYNWHWFKHWGTGEICNNGTHELDVCRWALQVDYPTRVTASGGRYHHRDDWEFPDTQVANFEFDGQKQITWDCRSSNGFPLFDRGRGAIIQGDGGTVLLDRDGYIAYDPDNKEIARRMVGQGEASMDTRGGGDMTDLHIRNFLDAVRGQARLNAPIHEAARSVLMCLVGNIAQDTGRALTCDPFSGHVVGDEAAMASWSRTYQPGWEMTV
jgi:predicted dehydrogenase